MSASGRVHGRKTPSDRRLPLRLLQTCVQTLGRVQDSLPAWLCSPNVPSAKPPPRPPPASAPDGREQGGPERGLPAQDTGAPGLARLEEWERRRRQPPLGRPPLLGGPGHAPTGHPVLRGQRGHRGTAPPCLQGRGQARLIPEVRPRLQSVSVHPSSQQITSLESGKLFLN